LVDHGVTVSEFAPAKVNLYLHVTGRRDDGYHLLDSLVVFVDVGDQITVSPSDGLSLRVTGPFANAIAGGASDNLVLRAAQALAGAAGVEPRAEILLDKQLPVAAGIGGGSTDAAAALRALMSLWQVSMDPETLFDIALDLGADVPACLIGQPVVMSGIGNVLTPIPGGWPTLNLVLVNAGRPLSTAAIFQAREGAFSMARPLTSELASLEDVMAVLAGRRNDLEPVACALAPEVGETLTELAARPDCLLARMSGSGATCFGVFPSPGAASFAARQLAAAHPSWWVVAGETMPAE
jgi:4-diphosphocytidyl-2-C-methyl-D-erythritol kinase